MATSFRKFLEGLRIIPKTASTASEKGDLDVTDSSGKLNYHNGTSPSPIVTEAHSATLTNKTIDGDDNTVQDLALTSLKTSLADADKVIRRDAAGVVISGNALPNSSTIVTTDSSATLTNKTIDTAGPNTIKINGNTLSASAGTATVTVPNSTDTLVGKATTDILSNKTIDTAAPNTIKINGNTLSATAGTATVTIPNSTDTLVGRATTDTLTNKTFDAQGTGNSLTNITDTNIKTGAAINRAKLASGTASHVIINDGAGVLSSEAQLAISRGGTGQATQTAAFDALSPTTTAGDVIVHNGTNNVRLGRGTDGQVLVVDNNQTNKLKWTTLQQGAKNYILYGTFENNDAVTGWSLAHSTLDSTSKLPNQTSASWTAAAGTLSKSIVSSGQLAGSYSLSLASGAATTAGDMLVTSALTLDLEAQGTTQAFSFFYKVVSGAANANFSGTSSNSIGVAIYVVDGSLAGTWIQPAGVYNLVQSSGVGKASGTFQVPIDATQVRLAVYFPNATTGALTVYFDDFVLGPQISASAPAVSDWQAYTPVLGSTGTPPTLGTNTTKAYWRRVGDSMEITYTLAQTTAGSAGTGTILIPIPSGLSIDTNKIAASNSATIGAGGAVVGSAQLSDSTGVGPSSILGDVIVYNSQNLQVTGYASTSGTQLLQAWGPNFPVSKTTLYVSFSATFPIVGWSSNTVSSADTDTRVVAAVATGAASTSMVSGTNYFVAFPTTYLDTHGAITTSSSSVTTTKTGWYYTIPVAGYYNVSTVLQLSSSTLGTSNTFYAVAYKNGAAVRTLAQAYGTAGTQSVVISGGTIISCAAGDYIEIQAFQNSGGGLTLNSGGCSVSIQRLSGPAVIQATDTVAAAYYLSANQSAGTGTPINFDTKIYDTTGSVTTGASWKFTAPISGKYSISVLQYASSAATVSMLYKNGSASSEIAECVTGMAATGTIIILLNAGDYIDIRPSATQTILGGSISAASAAAKISICRVGG